MAMPAVRRRARDVSGCHSCRVDTTTRPEGRSLSRTRRAALWIAGALTLIMGAAGLAARFVPVTNHELLLAAAASPYLTIAAPLAMIMFLAGRRRLAAAVSFALTAAAVAAQLPWYLPSSPPDGATVGVRVLTVNLGLGLADAGTLTRAAGDQADLLVVQELTADAVARLDAAGLGATFPYRALDPRDWASGAGIWSRYPITDTENLGGYALALVSARVRLPDVSVDPVVLSAHLAGPWPQSIDTWRGEIEKFPTTMRDAADKAGSGAVIIAGDFNATSSMRPFRDLLIDGYRDAAEQAGAGIQRTYPADARVPPLLGIDHVLTFQSAATSAKAVRIPGSDHLGLMALVEVPRR